MCNPSERTPVHKDAKFWLACAIIILFATFTAAVYARSSGFSEAFNLWDNIALIFSGLVGGLLGFTVNYTRANQAEEKAKKEEERADEVADAARKSKEQVRTLRPLLEEFSRIAKARESDETLHVVRVSPRPQFDEDRVIEVTSEALGKSLSVANTDPGLQLLAKQVEQALSQVNDVE